MKYVLLALLLGLTACVSKPTKPETTVTKFMIGCVTGMMTQVTLEHQDQLTDEQKKNLTGLFINICSQLEASYEEQNKKGTTETK